VDVAGLGVRASARHPVRELVLDRRKERACTALGRTRIDCCQDDRTLVRGQAGESSLTNSNRWRHRRSPSSTTGLAP
jgi:hypothetical protein